MPTIDQNDPNARCPQNNAMLNFERCKACWFYNTPIMENMTVTCAYRKPAQQQSEADMNKTKTTVVHIKRNKFDVAIDRRTIYGNKFVIGLAYPHFGYENPINREQSIALYRVWFIKKLKERIFKDRVHSLKGKILGCWCKQQGKEIACHGDIIAKYLDEGSLEE